MNTRPDTIKTPEPIGATTIVRRRAAPLVEWVEVEGEIVAWNGDTQDLHLLDPIASLIFQLSDGSTTLAENTTDLAQAFGQPEADIASDISACLSNLRDLGLVEVVE